MEKVVEVLLCAFIGQSFKHKLFKLNSVQFRRSNEVLKQAFKENEPTSESDKRVTGI